MKNYDSPLLIAGTVSRRRLIAGGAIGLSGLAAQTSAPNAIHAAKAIHQKVAFKASPSRIYEVLLNAKQFSTFSSRPAIIDRAVGGPFSLFGGHIVGRNLELVPNRRIVQAWRVAGWPEGVHSIARFELRADDSGPRVTLDHTGFPSELAQHLESGWQANYWKPLQQYLDHPVHLG